MHDVSSACMSDQGLETVSIVSMVLKSDQGQELCIR